MNKISSIALNGRGGKAISDRPNDDLVMALAATRGLALGRKASQQDARDNQPSSKDNVVLGELAAGDQAIDLSMESASSLPALFDAPAESFATLAQAPASTMTSAGSSSAGFFETASATQIGAIALGVIAVGAAASSGGSSSGSSSGGGTSSKVVPAPTVATGAAGVISVTLGGDATSAKLFQGTSDITSKFNAVKVGQVVTFTPVSGQIELTAQAITAKAADSAGLSSVDSTAVSYTFDNVAPAAPTVTAAAATGVITVALSATSDAASTKLLQGSTDITSKFTSAVSGSTVTFTPIAGKVEIAGQPVTATAADAAKNVSAASAAVTYTFDNAIDINASNASTAFTAAGADYQFTFAEGTYAASLAGFSLGDRLVFNGTLAPPSFTFVNTSSADGNVRLTATYVSNIVDLTLTGLAPASDAQILGASSFKAVFGDASLAAVSGTAVQPATSVTIGAANSTTAFDAANANVAFTISEGTYASAIKGFSFGDSIIFSGQTNADLTVVNASKTDGLVKITGNFGSQVVDLTLSGLAPEQDGAILGVTSFNSLFGAGSLGTQSLAQLSAQQISVSSSNASTAFSAAGGNFAYSLGEGSYKTSISGFGPGDSLSFFGSKDANLNVVNTSATDGVVLITGEVGGQVVDVTLTSLVLTLDQQVLGVNTFNIAFGAGSLIA